MGAAGLKELEMDSQGPSPSSPFKMQKTEALSGESVLDIGCGGGAYVAFCQALGKRAVGVDLDFAKVVEARREYQGHFVCATADALPFCDNEFETVLMWDILEHTRDDKKALSEATRMASRNILMSVPKEDEISTPGNGVTYRHYIDPEHKRYYTPESIRKLVENLGSHVSQISHWCRIYPATVYESLGVPRLLTTGLDRLFWLLGRNRKAFLRNLFVEIEVKDSATGGRIE